MVLHEYGIVHLYLISRPDNTSEYTPFPAWKRVIDQPKIPWLYGISGTNKVNRAKIQ